MYRQLTIMSAVNARRSRVLEQSLKLVWGSELVCYCLYDDARLFERSLILKSCVSFFRLKLAAQQLAVHTILFRYIV